MSHRTAKYRPSQHLLMLFIDRHARDHAGVRRISDRVRAGEPLNDDDESELWRVLNFLHHRRRLAPHVMRRLAAEKKAHREQVSR